MASTDWVTVATLGPSALLPMHSHPGKRWNIRDAPPWSSGGIWEPTPCPREVLHPLLAQQLFGQVPGWLRASGWARSCCWSHPGNSWQECSPPQLQQVHWVLGQICRLRKVRRCSRRLLPLFKPLLLSSWKSGEARRVGEGFQVGVGGCRTRIVQREHQLPCSLHCESPGAEHPGDSGIPDEIQEETPGRAPRPRFTYFQ